MKSLKFLFVALTLLMEALTFTSCKDDEKDEPGAPQSSASLVGTWVSEGNTFSETFIFSSNGTFTYIFKDYYNGEWKTYPDDGTYTFDGSKINIRNSKGEEWTIGITLSDNYFIDEIGCVYYKR